MRIGRLPRTGKMFELPADARAALERTLAHPLRAIKMIDYSRNSRLHRGMVATTRPGCILLCGSGEDFLADPEFLLHEYFHVVHHWNAGRMTRFGYLLESARRGYWRNGFEREAREFAVRNLARYQRHLSDARGQNRMRATEQPAP